MPGLTSSLLVRGARILPVGSASAPSGVLDVLVENGRVTQVAERLTPAPQTRVLEADGRWLAPGLWDHHVHMKQWALLWLRLDLRAATGREDVLHQVAQQLSSSTGPVIGFGHRIPSWDHAPTVAELDAVSGRRPVVLISGDAHHGWLNSAALALLGVPPREGVVAEAEWFAIYNRLAEVPGAEDDLGAGYARAVEHASRKGVVGIVDLEFDAPIDTWPGLIARGVDGLRVRQATYSEGMDAVIAAGLRTGDPITGGRGLVTMGPLKIITDGSLNTRTARCCSPYVDADEHMHASGVSNVSPHDLREIAARAHAHGLELALHAIGDAAVRTVLDTFEWTGARGSVEHVQLMRREDVARMATLGVRASVQPAHLLDDRDITEQCWPDRADRCFMLRSLQDAGVALRLGSDAPVAPLDPWLAMAAAVHRSGDERAAWHPEQAISAAEAFAASTDGQPTVAVGSRGDLMLLDANPLAPQPDSASAAQALRDASVAVTVVGGRVTWSSF